jgi:hypothetical protein
MSPAFGATASSFSSQPGAGVALTVGSFPANTASSASIRYVFVGASFEYPMPYWSSTAPR